ncbi:Gfo/Idh/MocA family oxidoreductase [Anaeromyxobacter oryzae]|uniref:Oxidoreductase n=1 Tax=Anaeromyxobacter oryzae TaxID=2918170 RepID=A0ABM7X0T7_9BACT|nr:Gfo/Idh/MocA family oxidoreductase [Anaeromyxobacter oryzae]BDG05404.1 oxidoreductase [Anaeromyxobacter oryzae]
MTPPGKVRVGIAGLGRLGRHHAENLARRVPGAVLVGACSPVAEERAWARDALGVERVHEGLDDLLGQPDVDAVFLVTPTALHAAQVERALAAGKHVFCEKPLALAVEDCRRVEAAAARRPDLVVLVGFVRRFDASYRAARAHVDAGRIGTPFLVSSRTCDRNDPTGFFVRFAPTSGGIFLDCTIHDIDLARWMLGGPRPLRAFATGTIALHEGLRASGDVDNGVATLELEGGKLACFFASRTMAHGHETSTEIVGTAGRLTVGQNPRLDRVELSDAAGVSNACTPTFYDRFEDAFLREATEFVDAVRTGRPPPLTLRDATEATRIAQALAEAQRTGRIVELG